MHDKIVMLKNVRKTRMKICYDKFNNLRQITEKRIL